MNTQLNKLVAALAILFLAPTSMVLADLLDGQTVETVMTQFAPRDFANSRFSDNVVGLGQELTDFGLDASIWSPPQRVDVDFSDTNILITSRSDAFYWDVTLIFADILHTIPAFTRVTANPATTWPNATPLWIFVDPDHISIGLSGHGSGLEGKQISLDINLIPEPATAGLLVAGFVFLAAGRRRPAHTTCTNSPGFTIRRFEGEIV
jgi:hypothetical protein